MATKKASKRLKRERKREREREKGRMQLLINALNDLHKQNTQETRINFSGDGK